MKTSKTFVLHSLGKQLRNYQLLKSVMHFGNNEEAVNTEHDEGFKIRSLISLGKVISAFW